MQTKLYVGNLNYSVTDEDLRTLFAQHGAVQSINIIKDRYTGQAKGFAFVEMSSQEEAQKALELNGSEFMGRNLNISEARPQEKRGGGGGGFGGGYGGGRDRDRGKRGGFGGGGGGQKKGRNWKW